MPVAWRIVKASRAASAFDGEGARLYGGRWNSPGHALVYTAENVSLAALELLVHLQESALLASYLLLSVRFPPALVRKLARAGLRLRRRERSLSPERGRLRGEPLARRPCVALEERERLSEQPRGAHQPI